MEWTCFWLVKEALEHNTRLTDLNKHDQILEKVKAAVEKKIGISTTITTVHFSVQFLRTIIQLTENNSRFPHNYYQPLTSLTITRICSGVVPQHPPTMFTPALINSFTLGRIISGVSGNTVLPSCITGMPALA